MSLGFVQAGFLLGLAAIGIPLILHLLRGHKPVLVELGTVRFLKTVLDRSAGRARWLRWLLMALRIVAVVLLASLFARPYLTTSTRGGAGRRFVVLVDRSASMQLGSAEHRAVERAGRQAAELLESLAPESEVQVAWFDSKVQPLLGGSDAEASPSQLAAQLRERAARRDQWGGTNHAAALAWARDLCANAQGPCELHVFSDFRQSPVEAELPALPEDVAVYLHDVGVDLADNLAITQALPERTWILPNQTTVMPFEIVNHGPLLLEDVPVTLELEGSGQSVEVRTTLTVRPGETAQGRFELPPLAAGLWQGTVSLERADLMSLDNERQLAILAAPPREVLILAGAEASDDWGAAYFLQRAVQPLSTVTAPAENPYQAKVVRLSEGDSLPSLRGVAAVIVADAEGVTAGTAETLRQFVARGGGLLIFASPEIGDGDQRLAETALQLGELEPQQMLQPAARLERWQTRHALLAPFADPQTGDLRRIAFHRQSALRPAAGSVVLAELPGNTPLLVERRIDRGTALWIGAACDRSANDLLRSRLFLPLVHQALGYLTDLNGGGPVRAVDLGETSDLPVETGPGVVQVGPSWRVANVASEELATAARWTPEAFAQRFDLPWKPTSAEAAGGPTAAVNVGDRGELWPYAALLLLAVVSLEFLISNRTVA